MYVCMYVCLFVCLLYYNGNLYRICRNNSQHSIFMLIDSLVDSSMYLTGKLAASLPV